MIRDLSQVVLQVNDVETASKFWQDRLGFVIINREALSEQGEIIEVGAHLDAETTLVLRSKRDNEVFNAPTLIFNTLRFDELYEKLSESLPVGEIKEIQGIRTFTFKDLDNHEFYIKEATELQFE